MQLEGSSFQLAPKITLRSVSAAVQIFAFLILTLVLFVGDVVGSRISSRM
nr:MAG TPA: hypothetical protein [Caudoviricetes sp.]